MKLNRDAHDPCILALSGRLTSLDNDTFESVFEQLEHGGRLVLDMAELEYVDSFGIGLLLVAGAEARAKGVALSVRNLQPQVARVFHLSNLDTVLPVNSGPPHTTAQKSKRTHLTVRHLPRDEDGSPVIGLAGRLTFADQDASATLLRLIEDAHCSRVVLDLDGLEMMDTTGLSLLVLARCEAASRGVRLTVVSPRPIVARVLGLSDMQACDHGH